MSRAQDLFDKASHEYQEAAAFVEKLDQMVQQALLRQGSISKGYDSRLTVAKFDMILQAILLNEAIADGQFSDLERQFVEKIACYGDLMEFVKLRTDGRLDLTWSQVASLSPDTQQKLAAMMPDLLSEVCFNFVAPLAITDKVMTNVDLLETLQEHIRNICWCLAEMDGNCEAMEARGAALAMTQLLSNCWRDLMNRC